MATNLRRLPWHLRYVTGGRAASLGRRLLVQATHRHCRVEFQGPAHLGPGFELFIPDRGTLVIGAGVEFRRGFVCEISGDGKVVIGRGTIFSNNALIQCSTSIEIGERCVFGQSTLIVDGYHRYGDTTKHWLRQGHDWRPIRIGKWVGVSDKCTIQADIGDQAMIASNSVVNRPIPAYCLAVGSPARVVRYFGPPDQKPVAGARARRRHADRYTAREGAPQT